MKNAKTLLLPVLLLSALSAHAVPYNEGPADDTPMSLSESALFHNVYPGSPSRAPAQQQGLMDAAELEHKYPLSAADRGRITVEWLRKLQTQEQIDQVYLRLPSGPIPEGVLKGSVIIRRETLQKLNQALDASWVMKNGKFIFKRLCGQSETLECITQMLWSGKRIYPKDNAGEYILRNAIAKKVALQLGPVLGGSKFVMETVKGQLIENFNGEYQFMLFPAKVHCGQSLLDARRESIIIDYSHGDDAKPFIPGIDDLAGRNGIYVRDEIRMVHSKLYLGRAYVERIFALNFTLEPVTPSADSKNACFDSITD